MCAQDTLDLCYSPWASRRARSVLINSSWVYIYSYLFVYLIICVCIFIWFFLYDLILVCHAEQMRSQTNVYVWIYTPVNVNVYVYTNEFMCIQDITRHYRIPQRILWQTSSCIYMNLYTWTFMYIHAAWDVSHPHFTWETCIYTQTSTCIYIFTCKCVHKQVQVYTYLHVNVSSCMYIFTCNCVTCKYVYPWTCLSDMVLYICTHKHTFIFLVVCIHTKVFFPRSIFMRKREKMFKHIMYNVRLFTFWVYVYISLRTCAAGVVFSWLFVSAYVCVCIYRHQHM